MRPLSLGRLHMLAQNSLLRACTSVGVRSRRQHSAVGPEPASLVGACTDSKNIFAGPSPSFLHPSGPAPLQFACAWYAQLAPSSQAVSSVLSGRSFRFEGHCQTRGPCSILVLTNIQSRLTSQHTILSTVHDRSANAARLSDRLTNAPAAVQNQ